MAEPYRPSNGTEGMIFMEGWCDRCAAYNICKIWPATMALGINDEGYPKQWVYENDEPVCTSFKDKSEVERKPYRCKETKDLFVNETGSARL